MDAHRLFYQLIVIMLVLVILATACAPQVDLTTTSAPQVESAATATSLPAATATTVPAVASATQAPKTDTATTSEASDLPSPTSHPFAGEQAWIAYQTDRGGSEGVWLIHPDGTEDHQIAFDGLELLHPDWSPDGKRLVVNSRGGETEPLYEYDLATETFRQLFECKDPCLGDDEPWYSPDGSQVAFIRALGPFTSTGPSDCSLWIGDVATGEVRQITSNTNPPCDREYFPRWSPDGSQLVYTRDPYKNDQPMGTAVYVINADGSGERRLTDPGAIAGEADWSPDGEWIVFATYPLFEYNFSTPKTSNLYRVHPDGSGMEQLTFNETTDLRATQPQYSPDGKWIVFTSVTPSSRNLWAIPAEGGEPIVITQGDIYTHGNWQP
jgi:Tol biopolymer transport system component